jgi:hypothetical protein
MSTDVSGEYFGTFFRVEVYTSKKQIPGIEDKYSCETPLAISELHGATSRNYPKSLISL